MFKGSYENQIDGNNRLRLPAKLVNSIGEGAVITIGSDGCLRIMTDERSSQMFDALSKLPTKDVSAQRLYRIIASNTFTIQLDSQSRFVLPTKLKEFAKIENNIVFLSKSDYIEVWAKEKLDAYFENNSDIELLSTDEAIKEFGI